MEARHKQILQRNRVCLVTDLKPSDLYDGLLEKGVFSQDMIDEIKVRRLRGSMVGFVFGLRNTGNMTCYGCSVPVPGGIRPGSWSWTWRPAGVEPFHCSWSVFGRRARTVWQNSYSTELRRFIYSQRHPPRWFDLSCSLSQSVSLRLCASILLDKLGFPSS